MDFVRPDGIDAALASLAEHPGAAVLAGGTDLMVEVNLHDRRPDVVISLRNVEDLRSFESRWIGASVTFDRLMACGHTALAEAARTVGSPQIRATATLGGNLGTASPAGDSLPWLAATDGRVVLSSTRGRRRLAWDEFLRGPKATAREPDELIEGVELTEEQPAASAFSKVGPRQAMVIAIVNCCAARFEDGRFQVALGSVGPTVIRARRAEQFLSAESDPRSHLVLERFTRLVEDEIRPIDDHRATAAYRRRAAGVIARRTVERLL